MNRLNSGGNNHISGTAEARVIKFCTRVDYIISQPKDDKPHLKGRVQCHVTHFSMSTPIISGTAEAIVAKLCTQVECIKCLASDDRLLPNGRGQGLSAFERT